MGPYQHYTEENFTLDPSFRRWVLEQEPADTAFWEQWVRDNPEAADRVYRAQALLLALQARQEMLTDADVADRVGRLVALTRERSRTLPASPPVVQVRWWRSTGFRVAASVLIVLGLGLSWWYGQNRPNAPVSYDQLIARQTVPLREETNGSEQPRPITLPDGSTVLLGENSRISYAPTFAGQRREVYLTGEAFFEVTKNPSRPFIVYAHSLVTRVVGTSFRIRAREQDAQVLVAVRTGRVQVYPLAGEANPAKEDADRRLLLTPNQQVVFRRRQEDMRVGLVSIPQALPQARSVSLVFDDAPVTQVLATLSATYGINLVYDQEAFANCLVTADVTEGTLYQKLRIVCDAIGATYEPVDGQLVIHQTNPCR